MMLGLARMRIIGAILGELDHKAKAEGKGETASTRTALRTASRSGMRFTVEFGLHRFDENVGKRAFAHRPSVLAISRERSVALYRASRRWFVTCA